MERSLTWNIFDNVNEFLKKGYKGGSMNDVAKLFSDELGAEDVAVFVYEKAKNSFRLVGTTNEKLKGRVGELKLKNLNLNFVNKLEAYSIYGISDKMPDEIPQELNFLLKLSYKDELIGIVFLKKAKIHHDKLKSAAVDLSMALRFLAKYIQLEDHLKKYTLLGRFTDLFEKTFDECKLMEGVIEIALDVLEAEAGIFAKKTKDGYEVKIAKNVKIKDNFIPLDHPLVVEVESNETVLYTRKKINMLSLEEIVDFHVKSMIASYISTQSKMEGMIILFNKKEKEGYRPYKHFDDIDLSVLKEISRRYSLAWSRLQYYEQIKDEVSKLEELRKKHEELISILRQHISKLSSIYVISQAMRSSYNITNAYKILLLGMTSPRGLDFDRALLLVKDNKRQVLVAKMWAGFESIENLENHRKKSNQRSLRYGDLVQYFREEALVVDFSKGLTKEIEGKILHYKGHPILERVVLRKKIYHVTPNLVKGSTKDIYDIVEFIGIDDFVIVPLVGRWDTIGVVILDNKLTKKPISDMDIEILKLVSESAGLAIENAMNYEELKNKTLSLERQKNLIDYLRKFSESILQNLDISVVVVDEGGKILEWNRKAEQIFGRPRENMIGTPIAWISPEFEDIWAVAARVFETREVLYLSNYLLNISGEDKFFDIKFSPLWSIDGRKIDGVIITFEDVTTRYILEQERKRQEKLAALGEMAARVAHELRNPISVIGGFLRRLEKHIDDEEIRKKYLDILRNEIERLEGIVNEILEFSRDFRKLDFSEFDTVELVREVYLLHEELLKKKGVEFEIIADKSEIEVFADKSRIKQVLINLIQNAIDEVPQKDGKIRVVLEDDRGKVRMEVRNNGKPIPPDIKEKIFTPFFTTKTDGTGLGLSIAKKIIEDEHNGKIWVESSEDRGTSFIIEIPKEKGA
ncbi:MAG: PAS domain-containing protein [Thermotogaceae bacterium]|nr:PAS domain-containing protein [Thermotogaceae bacterium]